MRLSCHDQSDQVQNVMKIRKDNDVTNLICLVYAKIETKLLGHIWPGLFCDEN